MTVEIFQGIKHHFTEKGQQRHCGLVLKELKMEDTSRNDVNVTLNGNINQGNTTLLVIL